MIRPAGPPATATHRLCCPARLWAGALAVLAVLALSTGAARAQAGPAEPAGRPDAGPTLQAAVAAAQDDLAATWRMAFALALPQAPALPLDEQERYAALARQALAAAQVPLLQRQFLLVIDRQPRVQAALLYLADPDPARWQWLGAAPVATGRPGSFDHFLTPLGVFLHGPANPDFRAEGTRNEFGVRGYGLKGLRVFDFGWTPGERGWGAGGTSPMRLQVHATDPDLLEPRLGERGSKGCVRIPARLNRFLDLNGLLDAAYDEARARGEHFWVFDGTPLANPLAGRWMVIVESERVVRPAWARWPPPARRAGMGEPAGAPAWAATPSLPAAALMAPDRGHC